MLGPVHVMGLELLEITDHDPAGVLVMGQIPGTTAVPLGSICATAWRGQLEPVVATAAMPDFFGVPLDYLAGRSEE